jgi:hypothetical protein
MLTTAIDSYCTVTGDATLHGTIAVAIAGLGLTPGNAHTLSLCEIGNDANLAEAAGVAVSAGGDATASLALTKPELETAMRAGKERDLYLYLWDVTAGIVAWHGPLRVTWGLEP